MQKSINIKKILAELEKSGKREPNFWLLQLKQHHNIKLKNVEELLKSKKKSIKFFIGCGFLRGRQDELSTIYCDCFYEAFDRVINDFDITKELILDSVDKIVEEYRKNVKSIPYKVNEKDVDMISSSLKFVASHLNPIKYIIEEIKKGRVKEIYIELTKIREWGPKLSSMLIRDVVIFFKLEKHLKLEDYILLFPIDTHVRKFIQKLYPETKKMKIEELRKYCVSKIKGSGFSPLYVNIGMWLVHAKAGKLIEYLLLE